MTAADLDWTNHFKIEAGSTFDKTWPVLDKDGAPLDMLGPLFVGASACLQLRKSIDEPGAPLLELSLISVGDADLGLDGVVIANGSVRAVVHWGTSAELSWDFTLDEALPDNRLGSMALNIYNTADGRALRVWQGEFEIGPDPARKNPTP
jgi:hypothetical protein